jgi:hypothetical protein
MVLLTQYFYSKHYIRASWDPSLIPKEIVHLEQTMTMFSLVQVLIGHLFLTIIDIF